MTLDQHRLPEHRTPEHQPTEDRPAAHRLCDAATLVVASALAACAGHLLTVAVLRRLLHMFSWKWWLRDQLLLSSVGYLLVFAALAFIPVLLHLAWPRRLTLPRLAAFLVGLTVFSVLLVFQRLAPWALAIVAVGCAVQFHRVVNARDQRLRRASRWLAAGLAGGTAVLVIASHMVRQRAGASALAAIGSAAAETPNVLLIILDTVRGESVGFLGGPVDNTPRLTEWARRGVLFDNAYSTSSWTLPSHASIFTGEYASTTGADWVEPLGTERQTLAEALRAHGVVTGGFVANTVATWYQTGLARGFVRYDDTKYSLAEFALSTTLTQSTSVVRAFMEWKQSHWLLGTLRATLPLSFKPRGNYVVHDLIRADDVTGQFLRWQETLGERPFFAFLNLFDAHEPYLPPDSFRTMYGAEGLEYDRYLGAIRYMDGEVDRVLQTLDRRGVLANTIVVVTSDHGESFGEHRLFGHGNGLYRNQIRVPLLIAHAPGLVGGTRVSTPVSLRDLPATILDLAGMSGAHSLGGRSLRGLMMAEGTTKTSAVISELSRGINIDPRSFAARADQKSLVIDSLHVIQSNLNTLSLFALSHDTLELNDLADEPGARETASRSLSKVLRKNGLLWRPPPS
ncbi:MAG: sulfatase [Gemmatimonadetes bacterium]|nr:sulfatase [Gemmatimonadota bacterium]